MKTTYRNFLITVLAAQALETRIPFHIACTKGHASMVCQKLILVLRIVNIKRQN